MEVLEIIWADGLLASPHRAICRLVVVRHQLGRDFGVEDILQNRAGLAQLAMLDDPAD
jgi:hypothetical protein